MANAYPSIMASMAKEFGLRNRYLKAYNKERDGWLKMLMTELQMTRDLAKNVFLRLSFGCAVFAAIKVHTYPPTHLPTHSPTRRHLLPPYIPYLSTISVGSSPYYIHFFNSRIPVSLFLLNPFSVGKWWRFEECVSPLKRVFVWIPGGCYGVYKCGLFQKPFSTCNI